MKRRINLEKITKPKVIIPAIAAIFLASSTIAAICTVFAAPSVAIPSIKLTSYHTNFEANEAGSWNIEKSAKWTGHGTAQVTFDVDTTMKTSEGYSDVLFVVDISGSMSGDKLAQVKNDMTELTESLLSKNGNRVGLVSFDSTATIESYFSSDKDALLGKIANLSVQGCTNYYQGLLKADEVLDGYTKEANRELIVLFLTDGYPNEETPNEIAQYELLKSKYPYMAINAIQYEMGSEILNPIKTVSDSQYVAEMDTLNNVLFEASVSPYVYSTFTVTDLIDDDYFDISNIDEIVASIGDVALEYEGTTPKITWTLGNMLRSGSTATLTINLTLKDEYRTEAGLYPTNKGETVITELPETPDENISSSNTPVLKNDYKVIYEANSPSDCSVSGTPEEEVHFVFETVEISDTIPTCNGYNFAGYEIITDGVKKLNDDYFKMPEQDVILRATWTKISIEKSMDGTVYVAKTLYNEIAKKTNGVDSGINFSSLATNTYGVNTLTATADDEYPVYYYRGAVSDNNVRFADICWKAMRTTSTGGVKLVYNGLPNASNQCTNTTSSSYGVTDIGSSAFNSSYNSPAYVGYMRGNTIYTAASRNVRTAGYVFANDVEWDGGQYTLKDTFTLSNWSNDYQTIANRYHYTCGSTSTTCSSVYYLNYITSSASYVITLTGVKDIEAAKDKMFANEVDSTVKTKIDGWYLDNIKGTVYEDLLEDTVFCNDRTIYDGLLKSKDDASSVNATTQYSYFGAYGRNTAQKTPSVDCPNANDAFTVDAANGNGALTYPVGLLTEDELTLAGHGTSGYSSSSYLYTSRHSWSLSPYSFLNYDAVEFRWNAGSYNYYVNNAHAVRPVVSIAPGTFISDGDGSTTNPWALEQ